MENDELGGKILRWTKELVSFPTYRRVEDGEAFRRDLSRAIDWVREWAREREVTFHSWEDRVLQLEVGEGDPKTGVVAHLDVVPPAEENWKNNDPFSLHLDVQEENTVLQGRGVVDDKGPLACLLAVLEELHENPDSFPGTVCLVVDTEEEVGLKNMREYFQKNKRQVPDRTLVMDGYFPLVAGEKGLLWFELELNCGEPKLEAGDWRLAELEAGRAYNQVPGSARARLEFVGDKVPRDLSVTKNLPAGLAQKVCLEQKNNDLIVKAEGKAGHGSTPGEGENAVAPLAGALVELNLDLAEGESVLEFLKQLIDGDKNYRWDGSWLGIDAQDPRFETGTTVNLGEVVLEGNTLRLGFDARLVPAQKPAEIYKKIPGRLSEITAADCQVEVSKITSEPPLLVELERPLPAAALTAYREVTGEAEAEPVYMGGRTDATAIPDSFAFGVMKHSEARFYNFHGANEKIRLEELVEAARIYHQTLTSL